MVSASSRHYAALPRSMQLEAGDVLALCGGPSPCLSIWPAGSAQAQEFHRFEQSRSRCWGTLHAVPTAAEDSTRDGQGCSINGDVGRPYEEQDTSGAVRKRETGGCTAAWLLQPNSKRRQLESQGEEMGSRFWHEHGPASSDEWQHEQGTAAAVLIRAAAPEPTALTAAGMGPTSAGRQELQHGSPVSSIGRPGAAGTLPALPEVAAVEADEGQLWMAIAAALGLLEARGKDVRDVLSCECRGG